jgi:hypothetical protein
LLASFAAFGPHLGGWLRQHRMKSAGHWNLLIDLTVAQLNHLVLQPTVGGPTTGFGRGSDQSRTKSTSKSVEPLGILEFIDPAQKICIVLSHPNRTKRG